MKGYGLQTQADVGMAGRMLSVRRPAGVRAVSSRHRVWVLMLALMSGWTTAADAAVVGDIVSVGFRAGIDGAGGGAVVRVGNWAPVVVQLSLENQGSFQGYLRVQQVDSDGDYCFDEWPCALQAESGAQRFHLYIPVAAGPCGIKVTVLNSERDVIEVISGGRPVRQLTPPVPLQTIPARDDLILVVAPLGRMMGSVNALTHSDVAARRRSPINVAHIAPSALPPRWIGLEMVDYIVWDEADATRLSLTAEQLEALIEWVRQGGHLLLASAKSASSLAESDLLGPLLPVDIGDVVSVNHLPELRRGLLRPVGDPTLPVGYKEAIPVVQCTLRKDRAVWSMLSERLEPDAGEVDEEDEGHLAGTAWSELISARRVGRGQIIFVAAALSDLLRLDNASPAEFYTKVLALREEPLGYEDVSRQTALFPPVQETVGFSEFGSAFMVLAFLFALVYLGLSTFGVWGFLRSRGWMQHNWLAFAAFAVAASFVSVVAVQFIRGVGQKLHQLAIVDMEAGAAEAEVTCYFGLKTGTHSLVDVWLPSDYPAQTEPTESPCFLRPISEYHDQFGTTESRYTDPAKYQLRPATAAVLDVPIRATVKRFEGRWRGLYKGGLGGLQANLRIQRDQKFVQQTRTGEEKTVEADVVSPGSTITSNLGVELDPCYLIHSSTSAVQLPEFIEGAPRGSSSELVRTYVHRIRGGIADGETIKVADRIYVDDAGVPVSVWEWSKDATLHARHTQWSKRLGPQIGLGQPRGGRNEEPIRERYQSALLLLTTLREFDPTVLQGPFSVGTDLLEDRCRHLDFSDVLTEHTALLIGFAEDPGPVTLCTRTGGGKYRPVTPSRAWTMYRIVIPVGAG